MKFSVITIKNYDVLIETLWNVNKKPTTDDIIASMY